MKWPEAERIITRRRRCDGEFIVLFPTAIATPLACDFKAGLRPLLKLKLILWYEVAGGRTDYHTPEAMR
jgi:hypothetical protein